MQGCTAVTAIVTLAEAWGTWLHVCVAKKSAPAEIKDWGCVSLSSYPDYRDQDSHLHDD